MHIISSCVAKVLHLKLHQFFYLSENWDGSEKNLKLVLKDLNLKIKNGTQFLSEMEKVARECHKNRIEVLWPGHKKYPKSFMNIHQPPVFLTFQGDLEVLGQPSLSVVGSRQPLIWVENWLEQELKKVLAESEVVTVSGGAIGIDQKVHQISLRLNQQSIAILPSGLLNRYPQNIKRFKKRNLSFLSEYFPWEPMRKHHFYYRNRLISAMSPLVLVVQAHRKSGTMITACHALDQGKTLCTLPSNPMENAMHGNLQMLFDGALMVRWASDLLPLMPTQSNQPQ